MRIKGDLGGGFLSEVELQLDSKNTKFRYYSAPFGRALDNFTPGYDAKVVIRFEDSREIDMFINMLERFRDTNIKHIGYFAEVPMRSDLFSPAVMDREKIEAAVREYIEKE